MHGQQLAGQFSLGTEAAREGVLECIIYGDGLVALTGEGTTANLLACCFGERKRELHT